jgi:hypothetical protein
MIVYLVEESGKIGGYVLECFVFYTKLRISSSRLHTIAKVGVLIECAPEAGQLGPRELTL